MAASLFLASLLLFTAEGVAVQTNKTKFECCLCPAESGWRIKDAEARLLGLGGHTCSWFYDKCAHFDTTGKLGTCDQHLLNHVIASSGPDRACRGGRTFGNCVAEVNFPFDKRDKITAIIDSRTHKTVTVKDILEELYKQGGLTIEKVKKVTEKGGGEVWGGGAEADVDDVAVTIEGACLDEDATMEQKLELWKALCDNGTCRQKETWRRVPTTGTIFEVCENRVQALREPIKAEEEPSEQEDLFNAMGSGTR